MSFWQAIILAVVQGLTEFLPVSSSGHLVILQKFFGLSKAPVSFDVLLHLGTLIAVVFFFEKDLRDLIMNWRNQRKLLFLILFGSLPVGSIGIVFKKQLESSFDSLFVVGICYLVTSIFLFSTHFIRLKRSKSLVQIKISEAFLIGIFQALAILPGVSRSGSTIVAGLWCKLSGLTAFSFSFLLAIPAIIGAVILQSPSIFASNDSFGYGFLGMVISGLVGYWSLKLLGRVLKSGRFYLFGWYCLAVGCWLVFGLR